MSPVGDLQTLGEFAGLFGPERAEGVFEGVEHAADSRLVFPRQTVVKLTERYHR